MAVEKIDLKSIWESGQQYGAWLATSDDDTKRDEMKRTGSGVELPPETVKFLKNITRPVHMLAIAEDWCGDVRRNVPVVARMCAENASMLRLRVVDKETKPHLMVRYLTNAAEAIPIVIFLTDNFVEIGNWGPRPSECKRLIARGKAAGNTDSAYEKIHAFYAADKHQSTVKEVRSLLEITTAVDV